MNIFQKTFHNKILRNGGLFSFYSFFQKGISFFLLILLAKFITPNDYGLMNLFNTAVMLLGYFVGLNTAGYLSISYFASKNVENFREDFTIIILITMGSLILLLMSILPFISSLSALLSVTPLLLVTALLLATCNTFLQILLNYYRVQEKVIAYGIYSCSTSILSALLVFVFVFYMRQGWYGYVEGQLVSLTLAAILSLFLYKKWKLYSFKRLSIQRFKEILIWGIPLIPHLATIWIRQGMDRYIIEHNHTTVDVGLFSFALNLTNIIIMIGSSFNNTFSVNIFKTLSLNIPLSQKIGKLKIQNNKIIIIYIAATIIIVAGIIVCIPLLMPNYSSAIKYFIILSLYGLCQCLYFQYCNFFFYYKKTRTLMYITFSSSLLHLFLSLLFTPYSLIYTCFIYVFIQICIVLMVKNISTKMIKAIQLN